MHPPEPLEYYPSGHPLQVFNDVQVVHPDLHLMQRFPDTKYPSKQPEQFVSEVQVIQPGLQFIHPPDPLEYYPSGHPLQVVKDVQVVHSDLHFSHTVPSLKYPSIQLLQFVSESHAEQPNLH